MTAITAPSGIGDSTRLSSQTTDVAEVHDNGVIIQCQAGFDGGLPQTFLLEVRHNGAELVANQSVTSRPRFKVDGLAPNTIFTMDVYALNANGRLKPVRLKTRTRKVHADVKYSFSAGKKAFKKLVCWCGLVVSKILTLENCAGQVKSRTTKEQGQTRSRQQRKDKK